MNNIQFAPFRTTHRRDNYACELTNAIEKVRIRLTCVNAFANAFATCDELRPRSAALRDQGAYLSTLLALLMEEASSHRHSRGETRHRSSRLAA